MPVIYKILLGEMSALNHEATGAYYAEMAKDIKKQRERELGETGLWLMSCCTKSGETS